MPKKPVGYNVGHKMGETMGALPDKDYKNKICYPSIHLSDEELPYLEELEVGDKVSFLCLFEVTGMRQEKNGKCYYDLDLLKAAEDNELKIGKALEEFMGEHKEVGDEESDEKDEKEG